MVSYAQRKPGEGHPSQVHITYDIELGDTIETKELPFVLGVLADLSGNPDEPLPPFEKRKFVEVDHENFGAFMRGTRARLAMRVDNKLTNDDSKMGIELQFSRMADFEPEGVVRQIEPLRKLLEVREQLAALVTQTESHTKLRERLLKIMGDSGLLHRAAMEIGLSPISPVRDEEVRGPSVLSSVPGSGWLDLPAVHEDGLGLLDTVINETYVGWDEAQREQSRRQISTLFEEVLKGAIPMSRDFSASVEARIADLDALLSRQLNEILHASDFQKLEGTWRGLYRLVYQSKTSSLLKIRVLNVSKRELRRDLESAPALQNSVCFNKVYEEEYGTFGGAPYGALIGDYEFGSHPQDIALLERISRVTATAYAPFVAAASPDLFNLESFTELSRFHNLAESFDSDKYVKWQRFRNSEESHYVGLTLPHLLMRRPYGPNTLPVKAFRFAEDVD